MQSRKKLWLALAIVGLPVIIGGSAFAAWKQGWFMNSSNTTAEQVLTDNEATNKYDKAIVANPGNLFSRVATDVQARDAMKKIPLKLRPCSGVVEAEHNGQYVWMINFAGRLHNESFVIVIPKALKNRPERIDPNKTYEVVGMLDGFDDARRVLLFSPVDIREIDVPRDKGAKRK